MRSVRALVLLLMGAVLLQTGCESLEPVNGPRTLRGLNADKVTVLVPKAVIGRAQDIRLDLPAGRCLPYSANEKGFFFKSEKPLSIRSWVLIMPKEIDGGVFVPNDPAEACRPFYVYEGRPTLVPVVEKTKVTLVDSSTDKKVTALMQ